MQLGIVSDVHGDVFALRKALRFLDAQKVDQIVCGGDLSGEQPYGDEVADLIARREIPCVRGNRDIGRNLPHDLRFEAGGKQIYMTHASPWHGATYIRANADPSVLQRVVEDARADVVILGHTHQPMRVKVGDALIVNPGSVWRNRDGSGGQTCAILHLPDVSFHLYDLVTLAEITIP